MPTMQKQRDAAPRKKKRLGWPPTATQERVMRYGRPVCLAPRGAYKDLARQPGLTPVPSLGWRRSSVAEGINGIGAKS